MAKVTVLFIHNCFGANGSEPDTDGNVFYHKKGTVVDFDDKKKEDSKTLSDLRAAGRIVPPERKNLIQCRKELEKEIGKQKRDADLKQIVLTKENTITVPPDIAKALADLDAADKAK